MFEVILVTLTLLMFVAAAVGMIDMTGGGKKSTVAVSTWITQSRGAVNADRGALVAQKTKIAKMSKAKPESSSVDPQKAVASLASIDKEKMVHYKTINDALDIQKKLYEAQAGEEKDTHTLEQSFNDATEKARGSLKELRRLTDEQVNIYKQTTNDAQAIKTANATYYTWENAVAGLSAKPLEDAKLTALDKKLHESASDAVASANEEMKSVNPSDVSEEDKMLLKNEILVDGSNVQSDMQSTMKELGTVFAEIIKIIQTVAGRSGGGSPLGSIGKTFGIGKSVPVDVNMFNVLQSFFNLMATQMVSFNDSFGGFMQSAGTLANVQVPQAPVLTVPSFDISK